VEDENPYNTALRRLQDLGHSHEEAMRALNSNDGASRSFCRRLYTANALLPFVLTQATSNEHRRSSKPASNKRQTPFPTLYRLPPHLLYMPFIHVYQSNSICNVDEKRSHRRGPAAL
jgi:hypothetical protein